MYGGEEEVEIIINADGTATITLKDFAERDAQPEMADLLASLEKEGISATVKNTETKYTGEFHKHTHTHGEYEHNHR